jgi:ABC-type lipoprotein release transport system permease subunit
MNIAMFAIRNTARNKMRAVVTVGAMGLAGGIMILYGSLMDGVMITMIRNVVDMETGDIQIHRKGYRDDMDFYKSVPDAEGLSRKLESQGFYASPRLFGYGLCAAGSASSGVFLKGIDVEREKMVSKLHDHMLSGSWLKGDDMKGVVIGKKLARALGVAVGDEIVVVSQAGDGSMANDLYVVRGVLKSVSEAMDRSGVIMTVAAFRELMALPEGAHEITLKRRDQAEPLAVAGSRAVAVASGLEVKTWRELKPVIARVFDIWDVSMLFMLGITYSAITLVTFNASLMSVFERTPEFGMMKALGFTPGRVLKLVFAETVTLASSACVVALALGLPAAYYSQVYGIDLSHVWPGGSFGGVAFDPVWRSQITFKSTVTPLFFIFVVALLSALYPGVKAALVNPVTAMRLRA